MIERRPFASLGGAGRSWLTAKHHFSFADYADPSRMGWGALRVFNDDLIAPRSGFSPHPHADMEIVTYVRAGALTHEDSLGNRGRTEAGDVQVMSAGEGIRHAEYNLEDEDAALFQIWIQPDQRGGEPAWASKPFPKSDRSGRLIVLASGFEADEDALPIRAGARVLAAALHAGEVVTYSLGEDRKGYLVPARGALEVNGLPVYARDGAAIAGEALLTLKALEPAELILIDAA